ncbi:MAG TPA: DUF4234 domain-containing protein [Acidimicrobiales bacterium]|jgi:hypothetical protein
MADQQPQWGQPQQPQWGQPQQPPWGQAQPPPPPQQWGQPAAGLPGNYYGRPLGRPSNPGTVILLTIVTFGIYALIWTYRQHEDVKKYSGNGVGGALGLVLYLFTGAIATFFLLPVEVEQLYRNEGQPSPVQWTIGWWFLLPIVGNFVWYLRMQDAINAFWQQRGAPAP